MQNKFINKNTIKVILFLVFITLLDFGFASSAYAGPALTYHGRLLKPDSTPVTSSSVQFKIQIRTPGTENCLMYEETVTKNLSSTNGSFAIGINDGTGSRTDSSSYTMNDIFSNRTAFSFSAATCASGSSYTPSSSDGRTLLVYFNDGSFAGWEAVPQQNINMVPQAIDAMQVAGFPVSSILRVANGSGPQSASALTPGNFTELLALINGTSTQYLTNSTTAGTNIPSLSSAPSSPTAGRMWYDSSSNSIKYYNGTTTVDLAGSTSSSGGGISSAGLTYNSNSDGSGSDGGFNFQASGSNLLTISNSGIVNIANTTTSSAWNNGALVVGGGVGIAGNINAGGSIKAGILGASGTNTTAYTSSSGSATSPVGANSYVQVSNSSNTDSSGSYLLMSSKNTATNAQQAYIGAISNTGAGVYSPTIVFGQQTGASAYTERMRIDSSGNVGIGTNSPASFLHLVTTGTNSNKIYQNSLTGGTANTLESVGGNSWINLQSAASSWATSGSADNAGFINGNLFTSGTGFQTAGRITFAADGTQAAGSSPGKIIFSSTSGSSTTPTERMRIDSSGKVGIGTTAPTALLHVHNGSAGATQTISTGLVGGFAQITFVTPNRTISFTQNDAASKAGFYDNSASAWRFAIDYSTGNVGIGTTTPDERLVVYNGSTTGKYTTGGWTHSSDVRLKHDIAPLENSLDKILKLQGVEYKFNSDPKQETQVGFIAQQVEPIFPEVVQTDKNGFKSMIYSNLVAPLVEAVKTLHIRVVGAEREIASMKAETAQKADKDEMEVLKAKNQKLEQENAAIKAYLCAKDPSTNICK